jgi:hypothetical protein
LHCTKGCRYYPSRKTTASLPSEPLDLQNNIYKKISIFQSQNQHDMTWSAKLIKHNSEKRIAVYFEKNQDLIARIKQIEGARWSQQKTVWHLPDTIKNRERFKIELLENSLPSPEGIAQIEKFKQWLRSKRYSESTIGTYSEALKSFLIFYHEKPVDAITNEDVIIYNNPLGVISFDDNFSSVRVIFDRKSYREQEKFH